MFICKVTCLLGSWERETAHCKDIGSCAVDRHGKASVSPFASAPRALSTLVLCNSHHYCLLWRRVLSLAWEPLGTCIWVLAHRLCSDSLDCFELGCNDFSQDLEILPFRILDVFSNIRLSPNGCTLLSY